jgi:sirohydrochlorin cobaltochelatase
MTKQGVLVIAHGSSNKNWVAQVDACIAAVSLPVPVVVSFLEMVEGRTIADGIAALQRQDVHDIVAIPLFVSSGSTHIEEIRYLLGLTKNPHKEMDEPPIKHTANIRLLSPMNDHELIIDILVERIKALSENINREHVLLVGHGSDLPWFQAEWERVASSIAQKLQMKLDAKAVSYAFTLPDTLRSTLKAASSHSPVLLIPLFLSEGYFTSKKIPDRVNGLMYRYNGKAYLPHTNVSKWVEAVAKEALLLQEQVQ